MTAVHWRGISLLLGSVLVAGAVGSARAADEWFVLGETALKSENPSVEIKAEGNRWDRNVKKVKMSAVGSAVEVDQVKLKWDNARDEDIWSVGTIKDGGETAPHDAPGLKGRLQSVVIKYKVLGDKPVTPSIKIWGYD